MSQIHQNTKKQEVAKQWLHMRWLIIDEIGMVNASLLFEIDFKLRALACDSSPFTKKQTRKTSSAWRHKHFD